MGVTEGEDADPQAGQLLLRRHQAALTRCLKPPQYCSSSAKLVSSSSSYESMTELGSKPGALSLSARPISASLALTSSIDFEPKLRMSSRSCSLRDSSSPTVWMPSRLRQLYDRTVRLRSSTGRARSAASCSSTGDGPM